MQLTGDDKTVFLPGETTHGHHQIEMACAACHTDPLGGGDVLQDACMNCHGAELKVADDSHPKSKFTDPRNASRVAKLDARQCITCHIEHRPEITNTMGVTVPDDVCHVCHKDIADDRPSHAGMDFITCASAGCHNFHDNRGLYEDFLIKHLHEPANLAEQSVPATSDKEVLLSLASYPADKFPARRLALKERDAPESVHDDARIAHDWFDTAHSQAGVNCSACHQVTHETSKVSWTDKPDHKVCLTCHKQQGEGFLAGKHGMRLAQDLSPMTPAMAKIPMHKDAASKELNCVSCHRAHRFDTQHAAVDACLACHADEHSKQYKDSPHYTLWKNELNGTGKPQSGVSCATCHLPATEARVGDKRYVHTQHNQNDNLRPNEKMLRSVCMSCHGLEFAIDALADRKLIDSNFNGKPAIHIESLDMAEKRKREADQRGIEGL